jgi:hypothetical protein
VIIWPTSQWFSPDPPVSSNNKTDCHDIHFFVAEILLKVALNTIKQKKPSLAHQIKLVFVFFV